MDNKSESMPVKTQSMSHKGEKRKSYIREFKKKVIKHAKDNSIHSAANCFKVVHKILREWLKKRDKVSPMKVQSSDLMSGC